MPRANRYFLPNHLWHLTHRCHERAFLLRFARDRQLYLHWLFEARKRFGLCVLDYLVTSNHVHLLLKDTGEGIIASSMQLIAGRTAQEYNYRKGRAGAFWEDRYHATAVEANEHLQRCLTYIDLNMVRAGVVAHPSEWMHCGYREIHAPPERYGIIDLAALSALCGFGDLAGFQRAHRQWVEDALAAGARTRDERWSQSVAVGSASFVDAVKRELGARARGREIAASDGLFALQESRRPYRGLFKPENSTLRLGNTLYWNECGQSAAWAWQHFDS
jgi:putative transposase